MSRKRKKPAQSPTWEPFRECQAVDRLSGEPIELPEGEVLFGNNLYNVSVRRTLIGEADGLWLSINRRDRKTVRDWRHLQRIKNEIVGPECEAVELFPAESRLVDTSNQFHLWCCTHPEMRFPFGIDNGRLVMTPEELAEDAPSAVQRPFEFSPDAGGNADE